MTKGKVVLVPFPFDDLSATKVRPAVCLTDAIGAHRHVVLAFVTSQRPPVLEPTDLVIGTGDPGFAMTGLRCASVQRVHRMLTATTGLIHRQLGELTGQMLAEVESRLRLLFGLSSPAPAVETPK